MSYKEFYIHPLIGNIPFSLWYVYFLLYFSCLFYDMNRTNEVAIF